MVQRVVRSASESKLNWAALSRKTAVLALSDGTILWGYGAGAQGYALGEVVFATGMSGYQETLTDPSFAEQIITFSFPHIGVTGINSFDHESVAPVVRGCILRASLAPPSHWQCTQELGPWLRDKKIIAITGIDTRALVRKIRQQGTLMGGIAHTPDQPIDPADLLEEVRRCPHPEGRDLASHVVRRAARRSYPIHVEGGGADHPASGKRVVLIDLGAKSSIVDALSRRGHAVTCVTARTPAYEILRLRPSGVVISNGPGDPSATAPLVLPMLRTLLGKNLPLFGICLGHQLLCLALGAKTFRMPYGHRGINQPVQCVETGRVVITSQNHGYAVDPATLPGGARVTHRSLFDDSIEGIAVDEKPFFSVQYHPEAHPGPHDSSALFTHFTALMDEYDRARVLTPLASCV